MPSPLPPILMWLLGGFSSAWALTLLAVTCVVVRSQQPQTIVRFHVISRVTNVVGFAVLLLAIAPRYKAEALRFGTALPHPGILLIQTSDFVNRQLLAVIAATILVFLVETVWIAPRLRAVETRTRAKLWSATISVAGLVLLGFGNVAIVMTLLDPMIDLS